MGCSRSDYYDRLESMDEDLKLKALKSLTYREMRRKVIDDQTIMFWNLQLQFMEMNTIQIQALYFSIFRKDYYEGRSTPLYHDDLATYIALQLSGLA